MAWSILLLELDDDGSGTSEPVAEALFTSSVKVELVVNEDVAAVNVEVVCVAVEASRSDVDDVDNDDNEVEVVEVVYFLVNFPLCDKGS